MKLVGFNFMKISGEKKAEISKELKINSNIDIKDIKKLKQEFFKAKQDLIEIDFNYTISYNPDVGSIILEGKLVLAMESKELKDALKSWESKELSDDFKIPLFNLILRKSSVKAFEIEEELNLPLHMPLQRIQKKE